MSSADDETLRTMSSSKPRDVGKEVKEKSKSPAVASAVAAADTRFRTEVLLIPDTASCEGNSKICLIFDETPDSLISGKGRVEICVQTNEKSDRIVATQINQRTFLFLAPNNREGDATVMVFVNGTELTLCYLRYRSDTVHLVAGLSQIYLQFLSTVCRYMYTLQMKYEIPSPVLELDRLLAESFEDKDNKNNIPAKAFEEHFDILRHSSTDAIQSEYEFPTLLHLSGEYGLEQLAGRLLDLPGATRASNVFNHHGRTASELARNNGYLELAKTLDTSNKMNSNLVDVKNPLKIPTCGSKVNILIKNNLQLRRPNPSEDDDYMLLENSTSVVDSETNHSIFPRGQQPSNTVASAKPQKPPPAPCQKFIQHKVLASSIIESQPELPTLPPRFSEGTAPPPVPRRESRDSGVNVDGVDAPGPPPPTARKRPPLMRGVTDPGFVCNEEGHYGPSRKSNQDTAGSTVQRNLSLSGEEIARQLKKPVRNLPQPGTKGSCVSK